VSLQCLLDSSHWPFSWFVHDTYCRHYLLTFTGLHVAPIVDIFICCLCFHLLNVSLLAVSCVMCPIVTDGPMVWCVRLSVLQPNSAKSAEWIEFSFRVETLDDPRHIVLHEVPIPLCQGERKWGNILSIVMYRNVAHIQCGLCQITLVSCYSCLCRW